MMRTAPVFAPVRRRSRPRNRLRATLARGIACALACAFAVSAAAGDGAVDEALYPPAPFIAEGTLSEKPMAGRTLRVRRATLLVRDLERSIAFYRDVMGLELYDVAERYNADPASYGYTVFNIPKTARKRMALFNTSDEVRGFAIEEVTGWEWSVQQSPRAATVLFETDDIAGLAARLKAAGHTVFEPQRGTAYDTRFVELGFLDPDGHLITAYQYTPGE